MMPSTEGHMVCPRCYRMGAAVGVPGIELCDACKATRPNAPLPPPPSPQAEALLVRLQSAERRIAELSRERSELIRNWATLCEAIGEWGRGADTVAGATQLVVAAVQGIIQQRDALLVERKGASNAAGKPEPSE